MKPSHQSLNVAIVLQMINPVAEVLKIPLHRVYANNLLFNEDGTFKGFDSSELTNRDGGKPAVIQMLKDAHGYETVVMVGDGATDMQARPPASAFIGFGGIVVRDSVKAGADWFVTDFQVYLPLKFPRFMFFFSFLFSALFPFHHI